MSRGERRHQAERIKARAARINHIWHGQNVLVKSRSRFTTEYYTAQELRRVIGRLSAMHCTHQCGMCKYEKLLNLPKLRHETIRVFTL